MAFIMMFFVESSLRAKKFPVQSRLFAGETSTDPPGFRAKLRVALQTREWTKRGGTSAAVGYKNFYLVVEGGQESNNVDPFKYSGNINSNIQSVDLSGAYVTVALMFDAKATKN